MDKQLKGRIILIAATLLVVVAIIAGTVLWNYREAIPPIEELRGQLAGFLEAIPRPVYFLAFVLLPAAGVPLTIFYLTAIPVLGAGQPAVAIPLAWTAVGLNMALTNVLTRSVLHPLIEWVIKHRHLSIPKLKPWLSLLIQGSIGVAIMLVGESVLRGGLGYILLALFLVLLLHLLFDTIRKRLNRDPEPSNE
jgi:hypothetical protein